MKTVIITGGTKGIGAEISRKFLAEGWYVLIAARKRSGLATENHNYLKFESMDVRNEIDHCKVVEKALEWTKTLDCFINCAGYSKWTTVESVDDEFWNEMIDTNLKGALLSMYPAWLVNVEVPTILSIVPLNLG